ncbi:heme oxygenase [Cohnella sp. 56]|uniref:heme oxygenase n=1 Tax=Cohnella sp. 56 TaxID=3113722 RepID=UPI0030E84311
MKNTALRQSDSEEVRDDIADNAPEGAPAEAIAVRGASLDRGHFRLADVRLSLPAGRITAIVGPNGSGKSTLLRLFARLMKADGGTIALHGKDLRSYGTAELARTIAMMPQSAGSQPELTVREVVAYGRAPHRKLLAARLSAADEALVDWALETTGTTRHRDRLVHTLSGGEQQKVRIAMALAQRTDTLLLDEPTTYLDVAHQLELMEMLRRLNAERGLTVVMVLHDLQQAAAYSDYLIAMKRGRKIAAGHPRTLVTSAFMREVYGIEAQVRFEQAYPVIVPASFAGKRPPQEESSMVIVTNTSHIKPGNAHKLIERFDKIGKVENMEGFLGLEVLLTENTKDYEEVTVVTRWNRKEDFQAWTRSGAFKESHAHRQIPDYILNNKITFYEVKIVRGPRSAEDETSDAAAVSGSDGHSSVSEEASA